MKLKKLLSCFMAAAIAASGVLSGKGGYSYLEDNNVSAIMAANSGSSVLAPLYKSLKESAYVTWKPFDDADGYNVYIKPEGGSYTQLDSMLIRQYENGSFRADAVGLKAGKYIMKVVPTKNGKETSSGQESTPITVESYDRSGFAFSSNAPNPTEGIGAYNNDGTLKSDAMVIYVTEATKKTVTATINGTVQTGIENITQQAKKCKAPMCFRIIGEVTLDGICSSDMASAYAMGVKEASNVTIEGIGDDATLNGAGLAAFKCTSVEMRNIGLMLWGGGKDGDGVTLKESKKVWIHNIDFFYGAAGSDNDQAKGDGSMDLKDDSQYVTISYNHFWDSGKMSLCGMKSESGENWITYHHNWFDHSDSRHPRIRTMSVHAYNNYYDGNSKYGVGVTYKGNAFVEANYFRNCNYPMLISMQGSDIISGGTFSGEDGGMIKAYGNVIEGAKSYITQSKTDDKQGIDAYEASSRSEKVPADYKAKQGGTSYNNFDTDSSIMYTYTADAAKDVPDIVKAEAGRLNGGDFDFTFTSADDTDHSVNSNLMSALKAYKTSVIAIGSGFTSDTATAPEPTDAPVNPTDKPSVTTKTSGESVTPGDVKIVYAGGWNEMAYLVATGLTDADVTAVSYSGAATGELKGDDLKYLVRDTQQGLRVDILGLKPGTYTITLDTAKGKVSQAGIVVGEQDRSGFAHYDYTAGVGAYNDDGTLKPNAKILYITDENKDTVTITSKDGTSVTGIGNILNSVGQDVGGGKTANGSSKANTNAGIIKKLAEDGTPLVVRIVGDVKAPAGLTEFDSTNYGGSVGDNGFMARMKSGKDITIEGVGTDATINGWGIHFMAESSALDFGKSFEVRNIAFRNVPEDCIGMEGIQTGSEITAPVERCWIHNCEFYKPTIADPAESDKDGGDGACDFKRGMYFTNSYCYYEGYHKTNLVGSSDTSMQFHLTYHNNYWKDCDSRGPLARQADIHMYNNIYDGQTSVCQDARANAFIFSEYNAFVNSAKDPCRIKSGGIVKSYKDAYISVKKGSDMMATEVSSKSETVSSSCTYANFDTNSAYYVVKGGYSLIEAEGQSLYDALNADFAMEGGCLDNGKADTSNPTPTPVVTTSTGADTKPDTTTTAKGDTPEPVPAGGYVHNFTENGKESDFYFIDGSLSTSKGEVVYNGIKLTQCLKMESATSISFTAPSAGKLILVFHTDNAGKSVKIDNENQTIDANGILEVSLSAGLHDITKGDSANLFYMVYTADSSPVVTTTVTDNTEAPVSAVTTVKVDPTEEPVTVPTDDDSVKNAVWGDINEDGQVAVSDLVLLNRYILKDEEALKTVTAQGLVNANVEFNDEINQTDSTYLLNSLSNQIGKEQLGKQS
ncbi:MAG: hypothetical protein NC320_08625 [Clostridium sp.]|nr:hypothetical protein [Clostridium sp.]MCM1547878.1 hypothetical protein [Ruminococcus sp.]